MRETVLNILSGLKPAVDFHVAEHFVDSGALDSLDIIILISELQRCVRRYVCAAGSDARELRFGRFDRSNDSGKESELNRMRFETLLQALEYHAGKQPEKLLIADGKHEMRYAEFFHAVNGFACFLNRCGVVSRDIVAVQNTQNAAFAVAVFGAQACGCICVPIDGDASQARIEQILCANESPVCCRQARFELRRALHPF